MNQTVPMLINLEEQVRQAQLPADIKIKLADELGLVKLNFTQAKIGPEVDRQVSYINFVCSLPWDKFSQDIVDLDRARQILNKNHYGLDSLKERILEYLSILILNKQQGRLAHQPIIALVGLVGSGKTSLAFSIAECLGRPIVRIPFGGLGSALQLRGESRIKPEAEPGLILEALKRSGVKNPVILLDELDRVAAEGQSDIMGVLVELLDPEQNMAFLDHYLGVPFDLSQVLFIATANNIGNIATAVLDRLEILEMPFYSDDQKIIIGRDYLLPEALKNAGLSDTQLKLDDEVWPTIVRPLGFDGGIRSLKRTIDMLVRRIARKVVEGNPGPFQISTVNLGEYLPA